MSCRRPSFFMTSDTIKLPKDHRSPRLEGPFQLYRTSRTFHGHEKLFIRAPEGAMQRPTWDSTAEARGVSCSSDVGKHRLQPLASTMQHCPLVAPRLESIDRRLRFVTPIRFTQMSLNVICGACKTPETYNPFMAKVMRGMEHHIAHHVCWSQLTVNNVLFADQLEGQAPYGASMLRHHPCTSSRKYIIQSNSSTPWWGQRSTHLCPYARDSCQCSTVCEKVRLLGRCHNANSHEPRLALPH